MKVALIGQPNVGKSTLFNRLVEKRTAVETAIPGTTRDQNRALLVWNGVTIELIDTPGLVHIKRSALSQENSDPEKQLEHDIQLQTERAKSEADVLLYVIDFTTGPLAPDYEHLKQLRKIKNKPVLLVVNKADTRVDKDEAMSFEKLGLGPPFAVSAINGTGTRHLLDAITNLHPGAKSDASSNTSENTITIALAGKPNVGKSSFFNALLKEDRVLVSPIPHTTRDPNNTEITYKDQHFTIIDTAGLRKKARIYDSDVIEIFSVQKTLATIKQADVILFLVDIETGITTQDLKIGKLLQKERPGIIALVNKWDTIKEKTPRTLSRTRLYVYEQFKSLAFIPIVFSTVKTHSEGKLIGLEKKFLFEESSDKMMKNPLHRIFDLIIAVQKNRMRIIADEVLLDIITRAAKKHRPPRGSTGRMARMISCTQIATAPPTIELTLPPKATLPDHYINYLKNQIRTTLDIWGTDIVISIVHSRKKGIL